MDGSFQPLSAAAGAHADQISDWCVLLNSTANPHVILRSYQWIHMYTQK